jgi:glycosyltransferase involved in cell wall biosynthesis
MTRASLNVVVLTKNEEQNLGQCLSSIQGWADQVFVVDSGSTDQTNEIAHAHGVTAASHAWEGYVAQRNWALRNLPFDSEWVLFLDADEYPTEELKKEIANVIAEDSPKSGFYIKRRFIWRGKWIRHGGYYPVWILRLMRHREARCEGQLMDEHFVVEGEVGHLVHDFIHDDKRGIEDWKAKHRRYATLKAREYWQRRNNSSAAIADGSAGDAEQAMRAAKRVWYDRLPLFIRAVLYFQYVFFLKLGFLDGPTGCEYHWLRGLWYPWLIDREILRMRPRASRGK